MALPNETVAPTFSPIETVFSTVLSSSSTPLEDVSTAVPVTDPYRFQTGAHRFEVPFLISVCILGVIGNSIVIAVYNQRQYRRSNAALYILNLAVGDLFLLLGVVAFHITEYYPGCWWLLWRSDVQCVLHRFGRFLGLNMTIFNMVAIAVDRYIAVVHALKYKQLCTSKRTKIVIVLLWILSAVAAVPSVLNFATKYKSDFAGENFLGKTPFACRVFYLGHFYADFKIIYISILLFYVPAVTTMVLYIVIVLYVRRNNQEFDKAANHGANKLRRSHWKTARVLLVVFMVFAVTYGLLTTYTLVQLLAPGSISASVKNAGLLTPYLNSCMNPIVYSLINPRFRQAFRLLICRRERKRNPKLNANVHQHGEDLTHKAKPSTSNSAASKPTSDVTISTSTSSKTTEGAVDNGTSDTRHTYQNTDNGVHNEMKVMFNEENKETGLPQIQIDEENGGDDKIEKSELSPKLEICDDPFAKIPVSTRHDDHENGISNQGFVMDEDGDGGDAPV